MTFTQSRITPARRPSAATAIGVKTAISEKRVLRRPGAHDPDHQNDHDHRDHELPVHGRRVPFGQMSETNYASGDEYVVEFLGYRFGFNADDFEERITAAAVRLRADRFQRPRRRRDRRSRRARGRTGGSPRRAASSAAISSRHWERVGLVEGESLVYWLRKLVFRGAWLDHRVKEGLLEVAWDEDSGDFGYARAAGRPRAARARAGALLARAAVQALERWKRSENHSSPYPSGSQPAATSVSTSIAWACRATSVCSGTPLPGARKNGETSAASRCDSDST